MGLRIRLVPATIFIATLMLSVKLGDIWLALSDDGFNVVQVRTAAAQPVPDKPVPLPPSMDKTPVESTPLMAKMTDEPEPTDVSKMSYSEIRLLQELAERRNLLNKREKQLDQREVLLKAAKQRLVETQQELKQIKRDIKKLLNLKDKEESQRINRLVSIYSSMKPKDAATIFDDLDMTVLLDVMQTMKERKIAPIIAAMNAKRARQLTKRLAERLVLPKIPK
jgi:flagellar motility protein MotE (MotC chaperone)